MKGTEKWRMSFQKVFKLLRGHYWKLVFSEHEEIPSLHLHFPVYWCYFEGERERSSFLVVSFMNMQVKKRNRDVSYRLPHFTFVQKNEWYYKNLSYWATLWLSSLGKSSYHFSLLDPSNKGTQLSPFLSRFQGLDLALPNHTHHCLTGICAKAFQSFCFCITWTLSQTSQQTTFSKHCYLLNSFIFEIVCFL